MILESTLSGHRESYIRYFSRLRKDQEIVILSETGWVITFWKAFMSNRLLLSTADDYLFFATILSFLRSIIMRQTDLVLIRPEHVLDRKDFKSWIKKKLYRIIIFQSCVRSFSIMPHSIEPRLATVTSSSIYDPAFFELDDVICEKQYRKNPNATKLISDMIISEVVYLGVISETRNIRAFLDMFGSHEGINARVVGRRSRTLPDSALSNPGRVLIREEHLDKATFMHMFETAQSVWCAFRGDYDNFSGIFCNAMRFGTPVWVTAGSRLEKFAFMHGGQTVVSVKSAEQIYHLVSCTEVNIDFLRATNEDTLR